MEWSKRERNPMAEHSPEPWSQREFPVGMEFDGYFRIVDATEHHVATVPSSTMHGEPIGDGPSNARRILACVNALAGVPDEVLEAFGKLARRILSERIGFPHAGQDDDWVESLTAFLRHGREANMTRRQFSPSGPKDPPGLSK